MKVSLIIFTLNEIDGMKAIMPRIKKEGYDQLIIVDGGSIDGTIEYAKENGYPLFTQKEKGAGAAFREAMAKATGDIVVIFSPDGNSLPEKIPELVAKAREGYDIVIASRYLEGAKSYDDDVVTAFGNWFFTHLMNLLFGSKFTDVFVMFRAYKRESINMLGIDTNNCSWGSLILIRATKKKLKIAEIPGDEPARRGGERKMSPLGNGSRELMAFLKEFFTRN